MNAPFRIRALANEPVPASGNATADPYLARLVKLIPAEVIALYLSFKSAMDTPERMAGWGLICLLLVVLVRTFGTKQEGKPIQWLAVLVAIVSFILWIYGMGQKIVFLDEILFWLSENNSSVAIGVWTFVVPYFYKGD